MMDSALDGIVQKRNENYSEEVAKFIIKRTLQGLDAMHQMNCIHRDIKSENILLSSKGDVKIADFGTLGFTGKNAKRGTSIGTVFWMSPEILK